MHYVYVPFANESMDRYAEALVEAKNNANRFFGRHQLIDRAVIGDRPLTVVGWHDRLYTLQHGTAEFSGVCVNTNPKDGESRNLTGEEYAALLIRRGLRNTTIDLRLWTCKGGLGGNQAWHGPEGEHSLQCFALRVAIGFRQAGYTDMTVVGYRKLVNLDRRRLRANSGHKFVQDDADAPNFARVTDADKVQYQVSAI